MRSQRLHYLDNLRALAMLAGVVFHAALAYSPLVQPLFPTADRDNSVIVDLFAWLLHMFRMPLFFVVAGYFTAQLVQQRGMAGMFRNRMLRIALPFVLCWPLLHHALKSLTLHAATTATHPSPLLVLLRDWLAKGDDLPQMLPGTGHLWFLYYLLIFYVLTWVARSLELGWLAVRIRAISATTLMAAFPLVLLPALCIVPLPHPAPESVFPQFWALGYFGPFFAFGYLIQGEPSMAERWRRLTPWLLVGSLVMYVGWLMEIDRKADDPAEHAGPLAALLQSCISVWATIACLDLGRRLLSRTVRILQPLSDAAYWTYLVHLPILFAIQYRLMDVDVSWPLKLAFAVVATMAICLLSHRLLVRPSVLANVFGGGTPRGRRGDPKHLVSHEPSMPAQLHAEALSAEAAPRHPEHSGDARPTRFRS